MRARIVSAGILATTAAFAAWLGGVFPAVAQDPPARGEPTPNAKAKAPEAGPLVAQAVANAPQPAGHPAEAQMLASDPIVIPNCRLATIIKEEVPSQQDGVLEFIGVELKDGERAQPGEETYKVQVDGVTRLYRRLKEGDRVEAGQLLGQVDDIIARAEVKIGEAKLKAANADKVASDKTRDEAQQRWWTQQKLYNDGIRGATSQEDLRGAKLAYDRYISEAFSKVEAINVATQEMDKALKTLDKHKIKSKISGKVKAIYKQPGEAVRSTGPVDPVLQIQNYDLLRAEGQMEQQYAQDVRKGDEVVIEPTIRESAKQTFSGHRLEITGVAVSKDAQNPYIVSGSDDGKIMVWQRTSAQAQRVFDNGAAVKAVACTPPGSEANWCLSGDQEGVARLWDLAGTEERPLREFKDGHRGAILCVAFSPDGKVCATGGQDALIKLWDCASGNLLYRIPGDNTTVGHRDWVTAVHFTPEGDLISASRDQTVRIWKLSSANAEWVTTIKRHSAEIGQLGVSADGKQLLDEQGAKEMRVLSWPGLRTQEILQNTSRANSFKTLALFSPDGRLVLTSSGSDGVLQLWRLGKVRSHEIRQLVPGLRSEATCAAFAPNGSFVAGGIKDRKIYVWPVPSKEEIDRRIVAKVSNVEPSVEGVQGQVRIMAEFNNPTDHPLVAGDSVTLVAYPKK
jgi:WD40 repeat protein